MYTRRIFIDAVKQEDLGTLRSSLEKEVNNHNPDNSNPEPIASIIIDEEYPGVINTGLKRFDIHIDFELAKITQEMFDAVYKIARNYQHRITEINQL